MATNMEQYRVEPLTDGELTDIRLKAVAGRAACAKGKDDENLRHWDGVLSLIAEVRRLRPRGRSLRARPSARASARIARSDAR